MVLAHCFRERLRTNRKVFLSFIGGQLTLGILCVLSYVRYSDATLSILSLLVAHMVLSTGGPIYFTFVLVDENRNVAMSLFGDREHHLRLSDGDEDANYGAIKV